MSAVERYARAATLAAAHRHEEIVRAAWELEGAGCRAVALDPPSALGRGIVELHEPTGLLSRLFLKRRCYCGRRPR